MKIKIKDLTKEEFKKVFSDNFLNQEVEVNKLYFTNREIELIKRIKNLNYGFASEIVELIKAPSEYTTHLLFINENRKVIADIQVNKSTYPFKGIKENEYYEVEDI